MRDDLVDTVIAPAGAEAAASLLVETRENAERVSKYLLRYKEVQHRRAHLEVCPTSGHCHPTVTSSTTPNFRPLSGM